MKQINENHHWRKQTAIDSHPELTEFLKSKPRYRDALAVRKILLFRHQIFSAWAQSKPSVRRTELVLFDE